jgi:hypothetical protein
MPKQNPLADAVLARTLQHAARIADSNPRARILWQRAWQMVQERGGHGPGTAHGLMLARPRTDIEAQRQNALDNACWILGSALSMGRILDNYKVIIGGQEHTRNDRENLMACARFFAAKRTRRPPLTPRVSPLTPRQSEVIQIVNECKGNLAEAARRLGRDRKSVKESYDAGNRKLAKAGVPSRPKPKTKRLPEDFRGQVAVAKDRRR